MVLAVREVVVDADDLAAALRGALILAFAGLCAGSADATVTNAANSAIDFMVCLMASVGV